ncbi:MAG TPA: GNAT family N-acetyltransferase [Amnibacterium sp.]|jgi:GNAT superfamily N-acetyltransferase|nr:GNAT family N-acetyltransferase [Amnibacterium sp.]
MRLVPVSPTDAVPAALLADYFAERAAGFPTPGGYRPATADPAAFAPPHGLFLLLEEDDGTPLGCGGLRTLPPTSDGGRMEVKHLYVVPAARGRGLGRRLLAALETAARDAGARTLVLDTNRSLEAAGGLYRSAGFLPVPPFNDNPNATDWYGKALTR